MGYAKIVHVPNVPPYIIYTYPSSLEVCLVAAGGTIVCAGGGAGGGTFFGLPGDTCAGAEPFADVCLLQEAPILLDVVLSLITLMSLTT